MDTALGWTPSVYGDILPRLRIENSRAEVSTDFPTLATTPTSSTLICGCDDAGDGGAYATVTVVVYACNVGDGDGDGGGGVVHVMVTLCM